MGPIEKYIVSFIKTPGKFVTPEIVQMKDYPNIKVETLDYYGDSDYYHNMRVYIPEDTTTPKPLIIDIHGGAWMVGDASFNEILAYELASSGFYVMVPAYRLAPEVKLKDMVGDVYKAFEYIFALTRYNINFKKVSLMGDSAGGHLALLCYSICKSPELMKSFELKKINVSFNSIVLNHPVVYTDKLMIKKNRPFYNWFVSMEMRKLIYGHKYKKDKCHDNYDYTGFGIYTQKHIPKLVITSTGDKMFYPHTARLIKSFEDIGSNHEAYIVEDDKINHVFNIENPYKEESVSCNNYIISFIKKYNK